jgi:predicted permease
MLHDLVSDLRYRLRAVFRRSVVERELADEMRFHLEYETDRLIRAGVAPDEARRRARLAFGSVEAIKDGSRDARGVQWLDHAWRDLVHSWRLARRGPAFAIVVILSLALGVGATATVFNLTYNVLFAPLPLPHPEQLVALTRVSGDDHDRAFTWAEFEALRGTGSAGEFAATRGASAVSVVAGDRRESINLQFVDGAYFPLLGLRAWRGRLIDARDDAVQAPVVVLARWFAERLFPDDSSVVGKTVLIRGAPFTVVGVTPEEFRGLNFPGSFTAAIPQGAVPLLGAQGPGRDNRGVEYGIGDERRGDQRTYAITGRLTSDPRVARIELARVFERCCLTPGGAPARLETVDIRRGMGGGKDDFRDAAKTAFTILLAAMVLVLAVVCCNLASLLLVRASTRHREIAVRLSLGAARSRLVGQLLIENASLAVLGGIGGIVVAMWGTAAFAQTIPPDWADTAYLVTIRDWPLMIAVVAALTILCTLAFALYPAVRATRNGLAGALRLDARASRTRGQGFIARGVVASQVAVTVVLVTAASLFATTLGNLGRVEGGFDTDEMLLASLEARSTPFERGGVLPVSAEILRNVRAVPGVRAASMAARLPLFGGSNWFVPMAIPGHPAAAGELPEIAVIPTVPGHFSALGIRILSGRDFTDGDAPTSLTVAAVSDAFAKRYYAGREALDQVFEARLRNGAPTRVRIVAVVDDARYRDLREVPSPLIYVPLAQTPGAWGMQLVVRTATPMRSAPAVLAAIETAAPGLTVRRVREMHSQRDVVMIMERLAARLGAFVSAMALVLAAVGLYGVVAYHVSRRTSEIGIRLALGARVAAVVWLVVRETLGVVSVGVVAGLPLTYAAGGALRSQLFGVGAHDPRAVLFAVAVLAAVGLLASVLPARRAAGVDPKVALRAD